MRLKKEAEEQEKCRRREQDELWKSEEQNNQMVWGMARVKHSVYPELSLALVSFTGQCEVCLDLGKGSFPVVTGNEYHDIKYQ